MGVKSKLNNISTQIVSIIYEYTPREPVILPFKPINRPLKTDWYNGTTYNRPNTVGHGMVN